MKNETLIISYRKNRPKIRKFRITTLYTIRMNKMVKQKHNRPALKREYIESDIIELAERIKQEIGQDNGTIRAATAGWREMKDRHIEERERKALEKSEREKIKALTIPKSKYYEMKKELIEGMMQAITIEMKKIKA